MNLGKKGKKLTTAGLQSAILIIVIVTVLFSVYASLVPEAQSAGDSLNDSNRCADVSCFWNSSDIDCYADNVTSEVSCANTADSIPLASLFGGSGVVFVVIMAVLLIVVIAGLLKSSKSK